MKRSHWLLMTSLAWVFSACTPAEEPAGAGGTAPPPAEAKAALELPAEPTFAIIPSRSQLMELLYKNLRDPVDTEEEQQAILLLQKELESFQYVPSAQLAPVEDVEEPVGESFAADVVQLERYLAKYTGDAVVVSCGAPPCILYGDFDGDGQADRVAQVRERKEDQFGVFYLLSSGKAALVAAGTSSGIGGDILWMHSWRRVPRKGAVPPVDDLLLTGQPEEALIRLGSGPGGSVEVQAVWLTPPPTKQP